MDQVTESPAGSATQEHHYCELNYATIRYWDLGDQSDNG